METLRAIYQRFDEGFASADLRAAAEMLQDGQPVELADGRAAAAMGRVHSLRG
ncbi:hypothetical protein FQZ97_827500 [compost metagenome]